VITLLVISLLALFASGSTPWLPSVGPVHAQPTTSNGNVTISPYATTQSSNTGSVTFSVDLLNAPDITGYSVAVQFNSALSSSLQVLSSGQAGPSTVVSLAGVFDPNSTVFSCTSVNGVTSGPPKCSGSDGTGVVSASELLPTPYSYQPPSNVTLFSFTLNVVGTGFQQIHILEVTLVNGFSSYPSHVLPSPITTDGYFSNKFCGPAYCAPPVVQFTWSPLTPRVNQPVTFNATASHALNEGASIKFYNWTFVAGSGGGSFFRNNAPPVFNLAFPAQGNYSITLTLVESDGIKWSRVQFLTVSFSYISLVITKDGVTTNPSNGPPGTQFTISFTMENNSTASENMTTIVTLAGTTIFTHSYGMIPISESKPVSAKWDSSGFTEGAYEVVAEVVPIAGENETAGNFASVYVILTYPQLGGARLSLLETASLGFIILIAVIYGAFLLVSRVFRKKPFLDMEPV
jgi:hypothetical protein